MSRRVSIGSFTGKDTRMALSATLATLIGLLCNFKQEHAATEQLNHQKFMEWLDAHHHQELKDLISNTYHLSNEVDVMLREDQQQILERLKTVDSILGAVLSKLDGFSGIVSALTPGLELSEQAKGILKAYAGTTARQMILVPDHRGNPQIFLSGDPSGQQMRMEIDDLRFLEDDLNALVNLTLLSIDYNSHGTPLYRLTRNGAKYAALMQE
jgi:hypothetical protein